jgi:hypothetical protein
LDPGSFNIKTPVSAMRVKKVGAILGGCLTPKKVSTQALPPGHNITIKFRGEKDCNRAIGEETNVNSF